MATLLRSLKYVRNLSGSSGAGRLGLRGVLRASAVESTRLTYSQPQCLAAFTTNRNYVTTAFKRNNINYGNIDLMLKEIDYKIKNYSNVYIKDVEEVLQAATEKGTITSTQALLLIRCCGEFLYNENLESRKLLSKNVWETITDLGVQLDVSHYNALLLVKLDNGEDFSPVEFLQEMSNKNIEKNIEPNRVTFQRLIEQYCNKGDMAGATKILEHMNEKELPINESIFNSLIKGHSESGDLSSAVKILNIMREAGVEPSPYTYAALMCAYAKRGDIESIRNTLAECKQKDILLFDKNILDIIYTLAINKHSDLVDEIMTLLLRGGTYNKIAVPYINKLIEKNHLEEAFKLLKSLVKHKSFDEDKPDSGRFFIRKLITSNLGAETIIKYCKLLIEENLNSTTFELAVFTSYKHNLPHISLALLKGWKEAGGDIREHYFYPIFVSYSNANNLQGILYAMESMISEFNIQPSIFTVKDYIVQHMTEDQGENIKLLVNHKLQFSVAANAILLSLLEANKTHAAVKFILSTNMTYKSILVNALDQAFKHTKDAKSLVDIIHHQYVVKQNLDNKDEGSENESYMKDEGSENEPYNAKQFVNIVLSKAISRLSSSEDTGIAVRILNHLLDKGISIDNDTAHKFKEFFGQNLSSEVEGILSQLSSHTLVTAPLNMNNVLKWRLRDNMKDKDTDDSTPEFKMLLIQEYARSQNIEQVEKLLKELEQENPTYTVGLCIRLTDFYSKSGTMKEAEKWFNLAHEIDPQVKIDKSKLLVYAQLLVKNYRASDALKVLDLPISDKEVDRNILCEKLLYQVSICCPDQIEEFFVILQKRAYFQKVTTTLLRHIIRVPLESNNTEKAIEKFKWACENFKLTPQKIPLMIKLIEKEDAKSLQFITDLCTQIYGEISALYDLAIAFFDCDRIRQARKILETPGLRLLRNRVLYTADNYVKEEKIEKLEKLIKLVNGLILDMDPLYIKLLKAYGQQGDWQKSLALWTQMQEDNIQPSPTFMRELETILRAHNREIPFARTVETVHSIESQNFHEAIVSNNLENAGNILHQMPEKNRVKYALRLIEAYAEENNLQKALEILYDVLEKTDKIRSDMESVIDSIITKLAHTDDFSNIIRIMSKLTKITRRQNDGSTFKYILNDYYASAGKYHQFIKLLDRILDDPSFDNKTFESVFRGASAAKAIYLNPKIEEDFKNLSLKAWQKKIYGPINSLWMYKFAQSNPEAEQIWNEYMKDSKFYSISAIQFCKDVEAWKKFPELADKLQQASQWTYNDKRRYFTTMINFLLESEEPRKYELAFECLRHAVKIIPIDRLNPQTLEIIEKNLTNGQTIESLRTDSERAAGKATG